jgi:16S rRNA (guanine527-N7)-methyltransferase
MPLSPTDLLKVLSPPEFGGLSDASRAAGLAMFIERLLKINETLNLTRITSDEDVISRHILDSAVAYPLLERLSKDRTPYRAVDLGTGAGFPGLVVATLFPAWEVTLLDATAKKVKALSECLLDLPFNCPTMHGRSEDLGREPRFRETWDLVTARAVADLPVLIELALPLLKVGGHLVDWLTEEQVKTVDKSKNALHWLDGKIIEKQAYSLPRLIQPRYLLVVEKLGKTPLRYPRPAGQPAKHPL